MSGLQQRRAKDNSLREIAETSGVTPQRRYTLSGDTDAMRTLLFDRVERRISRRESWISDAEEFPVIDPKTGDTLCKLKNHKALASHDKNEAGDLEFLAKLANLLGSETNAGGNISINIAFPVLDSSQAAALEQAPTIDLPPMAKRLLQRPSDGKPK